MAENATPQYDLSISLVENERGLYLEVRVGDGARYCRDIDSDKRAALAAFLLPGEGAPERNGAINLW